ncbi:MAG TPA: hypothetical protein DDZ80_15585 [Cyanobacteria bacterium UBA8803]|nr:hypothetical protein [Cyanobacteria bacterium UBA9273]HBL59838.1 hypothetical protein [Cyanobacteria bacterium UBA8803]
MSEAETPNNEPVPEPTSSTDDSEAQLSNKTETPGFLKIVNLFQLPEGKDVEQPPILEPTLSSDSDPSLEEEYPNAEAAEALEQERSKDADWLALAQKMRQRNRRLLDQVNELKQALREKQEALNTELMRSQDRDLLLTRQGEELHTLQGQLTRLFHTLESSHQAAQRQQILIETLSEQLQSSQERVAQLERECALTQQRYNEQSHQLLQAASTCQELRTRLHRQQQQTLQFKSALEKCLEMPPSNSTEQSQPRQHGGMANAPVLPKTQPIQPWSAEPEFLEEQSDFNTFWHHPIQLESLTTVSPLELESWDVRPSEPTDGGSTVDIPAPMETTMIVSPETTAAELEAEEQLLAEMNALAQAAGLSESASPIVEEEGDTIPESVPHSDASDEPAPFSRNDEEILLAENNQFQTFDEDLWHDAAQEEPEESDDVILPQPNWPSPTLYPLRRPKKIKSLAAIDLPTFPRYRP